MGSSSPIFGVRIKQIWNHHLDHYCIVNVVELYNPFEKYAQVKKKSSNFPMVRVDSIKNKNEKTPPARPSF